MFPVVLVVKHHLHGGQALLQARAIGHGQAAALVAPATPGQKGLGQVAPFLPNAAVNKALQASAVGPRRRTKDPPTLAALPPGGGSEGILRFGFVQGRHHRRGPVKPGHQLGEGIAK